MAEKTETGAQAKTIKPEAYPKSPFPSEDNSEPINNEDPRLPESASGPSGKGEQPASTAEDDEHDESEASDTVSSTAGPDEGNSTTKYSECCLHNIDALLWMLVDRGRIYPFLNSESGSLLSGPRVIEGQQQQHYNTFQVPQFAAYSDFQLSLNKPTPDSYFRGASLPNGLGIFHDTRGTTNPHYERESWPNPRPKFPLQSIGIPSLRLSADLTSLFGGHPDWPVGSRFDGMGQIPSSSRIIPGMMGNSILNNERRLAYGCPVCSMGCGFYGSRQ